MVSRDTKRLTGQAAATVSSVGGMRRNGLDTVRLLAAGLVLGDHAFWFYGRGGDAAIELGRAGVNIFFLLSGYLVTLSWLRDPSLLRFLARRALRLLPALATVLIFTAFVLGAIASTKPHGEYLSDGGPTRYALGVMFSIRTHLLPGAFLSNPQTAMPNVSLWTLQVEVICYLLVALFGVLRLLNGWVAAAALLGALWGCHALPGAVMPMLAFFAAGALAAALGWQVRLPIPSPPVDLSYGVYLYGAPVQQTVIALLPAASLLIGAVISLPIVFCLAWVSWRVIEAPALRMKPGTPCAARSELRLRHV
jgi:peptidoglycan/LPS O-acetylase OafA/YrhL